MQDNHSIQGKICLVTGASSGIGLATSWQLARLGATVVMVARDDDRGMAAKRMVEAKSGNPNIHLMMANLASLAQVRSLAQKFQAAFPALHILINNAAVIPLKREVSEDGYEMQLAVNHLAPFLLTNLLLPHSKASRPARIITVSSMVHSWARIEFNDLQSNQNYDPSNVYAMTKLANLLFTVQLAKNLKGSDVTANSLHPGVIDTKLYKNYMGNGGPADATEAALERGASTTIHLATNTDLAEVSGKYFAKAKEAQPSAASQNEETARYLWKVSAELVGL